MNKISIIISFKNEGEEIVKTCKSIRETTTNNIDIIVLNDASDDNFDYEEMLKPYNVDYHFSDVRLGTSGGREYIISFCKTPYFLILDGHCRMTSNDWYDKLLEVMKKNENCIYCCGCQYFWDNETKNNNNTIAYGAKFYYSKQRVIDCCWNFKKISETEFEIPCILGANYACSIKWWNYIKGLQGLTLYGRDEPYLSYKSWMLGGKVKCIPNIVTLHKGREYGMPYKCTYTECLYNELVMSYILFPEYYHKLVDYFYKHYKYNDIKNICLKIVYNKKELDKLQTYIKEKTKIKLSEIEYINKHYSDDM